MRCEKVGARVLGMMCDAGGNNARLYKLLSDHSALPEGGWLPLDCVQVENLWKTRGKHSRHIELFRCLTHDLKTTRNALFVGWFGNGKKLFPSVDNIKISFQILVDCHERERERESRKVLASTRVSEAVIKPHKWSKMNLSNAEKVFQHKTLAEIATHLYSIIHVKMKDQLCGDKFKVSEKK